jgi:hypothetical protein
MNRRPSAGKYIIFLQTMARSVSQRHSKCPLFEQAQNQIIERTRAEQEILLHNANLAAFNKIAAIITTVTDPRDRFGTIIEQLVDTFNAKRGGLVLLTPDQHHFTVVADYTRGAGHSAVGYQIPLEDNPLAQEILKTHRTVQVTAAQQNPLTAPIRDITTKLGLECMMIVPLINQARIIGTLGLDLDEPGREFTPEEMQLAETIAGQIAGSIENARLLEQTQLALAQQQEARQALLTREQYLAAQLKIQNLLLAARENQPPYDEILQILGQISGADRVYLFENHLDQEQLFTSQKAEWPMKASPAN